MLRQLPHEMGNTRETAHDCEVVGIVKNAKYDTLLEQFQPIIYLPLSARTD